MVDLGADCGLPECLPDCLSEGRMVVLHVDISLEQSRRAQSNLVNSLKSLNNAAKMRTL